MSGTCDTAHITSYEEADMELTPTRSALVDLRTMIETTAVFASDCADLPDLSRGERQRLLRAEATLMSARDQMLAVMVAHKDDRPTGRSNGHSRATAASGQSLLKGLRERARRAKGRL